MVAKMKFQPISEYIDLLVKELSKKFLDDQFKLIGVRRGGYWIAKQIFDLLDNAIDLGELDISFYRDDFSQIGLNPKIKPSNIQFDVTDQHIVLVDDIMHTGRTVRAGLNEIFDYGRPKKVTFVCVFELEDRELPIRPDICLQTLQLQPSQRIKLHGPQNMYFELINIGHNNDNDEC